MTETQAESPRSIESLLESLEPQLRRIAARYRIGEVDAEDLLQDSLVRFLGVRSRILNPAAWLAFVFRRECLRFLERRKRALNLTSHFECVETSRSSSAQDAQLARLELVDALERIRPKHQKMLWWRYGLGMSEEEVAETLGCKRTGAKKACSRALGAIRRVIISPG